VLDKFLLDCLIHLCSRGLAVVLRLDLVNVVVDLVSKVDQELFIVRRDSRV